MHSCLSDFINNKTLGFEKNAIKQKNSARSLTHSQKKTAENLRERFLLKGQILFLKK